MIFECQRGERAVALGADLDVVDLVAPVVGDHHALGARLDPLHRAPELARRPRAADLLGVDVELGAEAAADLGRDHPDPVLADAQQDRQEQAQEVRNLGRAPERQPVAAILGQHPARLDRAAGHAVVDDAALDDDVGLGEAGLEVAAAERPVVALVGPELLVDERRAFLERLLGVGDHRQRVVLDDDVLGRVDHRVAVIADHERDRVADVLDLVLGQRPVIGRVDRRLRAAPTPSAGAPPCRDPRSCRPPQTPSRALAAEVSIETIFACASGERTNAAHSWPTRLMSST